MIKHRGIKKIGEIPISGTTRFSLKQKVKNSTSRNSLYYFTTIKNGLTYDDYCTLNFIQSLGEGEYLLFPTNTALYSNGGRPRIGGKTVMNILIYNEGQFRTYKLTYIKSNIVKEIRERLY